MNITDEILSLLLDSSNKNKNINPQNDQTSDQEHNIEKKYMILLFQKPKTQQ